MAALRTIFMGTPELARVSLEAMLQSSDFEILAVVTQPDQPKGRGLKLRPLTGERTGRAGKSPGAATAARTRREFRFRAAKAWSRN